MMKRLIDPINIMLRKIPVWCLYLALCIPPPVLLYWGLTGGLGREPIKALEHELGELALKLLILGLAITPLRRFIGLNFIKFRRAIGVMSFVYVALHLLVWLILDVGILSQIWGDILKRPYITIGMLAFVAMIPLAATSNNYSLRRLGPIWRKLHRLTYLVVLLGGVHFVMVAKGIQLEPLIYLAVVLVLLATRVKAKWLTGLLRRPA